MSKHAHCTELIQGPSTDTCCERKIGVPVDKVRTTNCEGVPTGYPPLSPELRNLVSLLLSEDDYQRISIQTALQHAWFTGQPLGWFAATLRNPKKASGEYQENLQVGEWHVLVKAEYDDAKNITQVQYAISDLQFGDRYEYENPIELCDAPLDRDTLIHVQAEKQQMKFFKTRCAMPYIRIGHRELKLLQQQFPLAIPDPSAEHKLHLCREEHRVSQNQMLEFIKPYLADPLDDFVPKMYRKLGVYARQCDHCAETLERSDETRVADNPVAFCFSAPWKSKEGHAAPCNLALGDYLGIVVDNDNSSREEVWKAPWHDFEGSACRYQEENVECGNDHYREPLQDHFETM